MNYQVKVFVGEKRFLHNGIPYADLRNIRCILNESDFTRKFVEIGFTIYAIDTISSISWILENEPVQEKK